MIPWYIITIDNDNLIFLFFFFFFLLFSCSCRPPAVEELMVWYGMENRHRVFLFPLGRLSFVFHVLLVFPHLPSFLPSFLPSLPPSLPHTIPIPTRTHTHIIAGARPSPSPINQPAFHHGTRDFVLSWVLSLLLLLLYPREVGGRRVAFHNTSQSSSKHTCT